MTELGDEVRKIARDMPQFDPRRAILIEAADALDGIDDEPTLPPVKRGGRKPTTSPTPPIKTCGLCGHEGPRMTITCPECGERW